MLIDWLIGVLIDFRQAGPINQISLLLGIGVVCGGAFGLLHRWRRSGFERLEKEIAELKRRLESALVRASHLKAEKRELEEQLATISARDLWSLMLRAENERKEGNEEVALGLFRRAVENTAPEMAEAALQLAQVHLSVFGDSEDAEHLVAADRYARIARNLVPDHQQARGVLAEVDAFSGRLAAYDRKFDLAGEHWDEADIFSRGVDGLTGRALVARLIEAAWRNIGAGHYYLAFALARRASMLADRGLAIDDLMRLDAGHCLGVCLERLGNYAAARERFEAVLAKRERVLGIEHADTLATEHEIGVCLHRMGGYGAARELLHRWRRSGFERLEKEIAELKRRLESALVRASHLKAEKRELAFLALVFRTKHEAPKVSCRDGRKLLLKRFEAVLAKRERVLGIEHADTLTTEHEIGVCLHRMGGYGAGRERLEAVLAKRERVLGIDHPDTLTTAHELGVCLGSMGDYSAGRTQLEAVLAKEERVRGVDHPETLLTVQCLNACLAAMGDYAGAQARLTSLLVTQERVLGPDHHHSLVTARELGVCLERLGNYAAAREHLGAVLARGEPALGADHPAILVTARALGVCLREMGDYAPARERLEAVLARQERALGVDHPATLNTAREVGVCLREMGECAAARKRLEATLAKQERLLGVSHPRTLATAYEFGVCLQLAGDHARARECLEATLAEQVRVLGAEHPDTLATARSLSDSGQTSSLTRAP